MPRDRDTNRAFESKSTQRERMLAGMLATVNADGYVGATIANVIARASVSRPTFHDYLTDKE